MSHGTTSTALDAKALECRRNKVVRSALPSVREGEYAMLTAQEKEQKRIEDEKFQRLMEMMRQHTRLQRMDNPADPVTEYVTEKKRPPLC